MDAAATARVLARQRAAAAIERSRGLRAVSELRGDAVSVGDVRELAAIVEDLGQAVYALTADL